MSSATPLDAGAIHLPQTARDILLKGREAWLKNTEVLELLQNYRDYRFPVSKEPPEQPPGGRCPPGRAARQPAACWPLQLTYQQGPSNNRSC